MLFNELFTHLSKNFENLKLSKLISWVYLIVWTVVLSHTKINCCYSWPLVKVYFCRHLHLRAFFKNSFFAKRTTFIIDSWFYTYCVSQGPTMTFCIMDLIVKQLRHWVIKLSVLAPLRWPKQVFAEGGFSRTLRMSLKHGQTLAVSKPGPSCLH